MKRIKRIDYYFGKSNITHTKTHIPAIIIIGL